MMKISLPSAPVLHEYLLVYGEEWVCEQYNITGDKIDAILYGYTIPTEERNRKKVQKAFDEDGEKGKILSAYERDHFIWDEPNSKHTRCSEALDDDHVYRDDQFLIEWTDRYKSSIERDMKVNGNGWVSNGWSLGERVINKTTSLTTDDVIHERMIRYYERGELPIRNSTSSFYVKLEHKKGRSGHNLDSEDFLDYIESNSIDSRNTAINEAKRISSTNSVK